MPASFATFMESTDAVAILTADHARVSELFKEFARLHEAAADAQAEEVARRICHELTIHATVEEEIFYPEARAVIDDAELIDEAKVEHATAKDLIAQIMAGSIADGQYAAKVRVLGEYISHHVREEQAEIFPQAQHTGLDMNEIGARILARKHDLETAMVMADARNEAQRLHPDAGRAASRQIAAILRPGN